MAVHHHKPPFFECECYLCEETKKRMKQPYIERSVSFDSFVAIAFGCAVVLVTGIWFSLIQ